MTAGVTPILRHETMRCDRVLVFKLVRMVHRHRQAGMAMN